MTLANLAAPPSLGGRLVLVPRGGERGERTADDVRALGGEAVLVPLIEQLPPHDGAALRAAIARVNAGQYGWVAVTSVHGADALITGEALPGRARIAAVGPATAERLEAAGFDVDLIPDEFTGARLAERLAAQREGGAGGAAGDPDLSGRVLLPLSDLADETVERGLRAAGFEPERVTAYRTVAAAAGRADAELRPRLGAVLVFSSSGARALAGRFAPLPPGALVAAIGEPTARELARLGIPAAVIAAEHTAAGTVRALAEHCARLRSGPIAFTETPNREGTEV
ncbi:uroporphyrinogen-III synthase [Leucobacter komagatae]|uniref:uroporphyrinogen-III synthase n=1 Tax=Leucobacter komagatae TaxID=55969 RepID=UPI00147692C9|nr:uroporphyrinogen-III synthase [Leucobacter komagatae]